MTMLPTIGETLLWQKFRDVDVDQRSHKPIERSFPLGFSWHPMAQLGFMNWMHMSVNGVHGGCSDCAVKAFGYPISGSETMV